MTEKFALYVIDQGFRGEGRHKRLGVMAPIRVDVLKDDLRQGCG
jgi:hypothetical protein